MHFLMASFHRLPFKIDGSASELTSFYTTFGFASLRGRKLATVASSLYKKPLRYVVPKGTLDVMPCQLVALNSSIFKALACD